MRHPPRPHASTERAARTLALVTLLALVLAGCRDDDPCARERLAECDIREESCHRYIFEATQCLRQTFDVEMPITRVVSRDELATELAGRGGMAAAMRMASGPLFVRDEVVRHGLELMGLMEGDRSTVESAVLDSIGGVFFPDTREVLIVDAPGGSVSTLAHEYVHAMQPVLGSEHEDDVYGSTDEVFRVLAGIEGEASFFEIDTIFWLEGERFSQHLPPNSSRVDVDEIYTLLSQEFRALSTHIGSPYDATLPLRYELGLLDATRRYLDGGIDVLEQWPSDLPSSSADLFAYSGVPVAALPTVTPPPRASATCVVMAPAGLTPDAEDSLGAAYAYTFFRSRGVPEAEAERSARALDADRIAIYADDAGEVAVSWRLQFADDVDLALLRDEVSVRGTRVDAEILDRALILRASSDGGLVPAWPLECR